MKRRSLTGVEAALTGATVATANWLVKNGPIELVNYAMMVKNFSLK